MKAIVGLGNPGAQYERNRHNVGFRVIERIAEECSVAFSKKADFFSEITSFKNNGRKVVLVKPQTFMNLSGRAVGIIKTFFKVSSDRIFVFHDDIDLKFGQIKIKRGGGSAGHNGLKSIDGIIGNDYWRIRIGVGRPEEKNFEIASYVLGNFSNEEEEIIQKICVNISKNLDLLLDDVKASEKAIREF